MSRENAVATILMLGLQVFNSMIIQKPIFKSYLFSEFLISKKGIDHLPGLHWVRVHSITFVELRTLLVR